MNKKAALDFRYKMRHSEKVIIDDAFVAKHFITFDVKGNGHCLFRSLAQSLHHNTHRIILQPKKEYEKATQLRRKSIRYICQNGGGKTFPEINMPLSFKNSIMTELNPPTDAEFAKYCKCQYDPDLQKCIPEKLFKWGGFNEIHALSNIMKKTIIILVRKNKTQYNRIRIGKNCNSKPLYIIYVNNSHYKALFPIVELLLKL